MSCCTREGSSLHELFMGEVEGGGGGGEEEEGGKNWCSMTTSLALLLQERGWWLGHSIAMEFGQEREGGVDQSTTRGSVGGGFAGQLLLNRGLIIIDQI